MLDRSQWIAIGLVSGFAYILGKDRESFGASAEDMRDKEIEYQVYAYINDESNEWGDYIGQPMPEKSHLSGSDDFHYIGFDSIKECKKYIKDLPKGWSGDIEVIMYDEDDKVRPEVISYEEYKKIDAESFEAESSSKEQYLIEKYHPDNRIAYLRDLGMPEIILGDNEERIKINGELVYKMEAAPMPIRDGIYSQPLFYIGSKHDVFGRYIDYPLNHFSPPIWLRTPKGLIKNAGPFYQNQLLQRKIKRRLQENYGEYTKKKPFECLCGKRFKNENALKKHQKDKNHPNYYPSHTLFDNELKGPPINIITNPDGITLKEVYLMFPNWDGNYKTWFGRGRKPLQESFNYFNAESFEAEIFESQGILKFSNKEIIQLLFNNNWKCLNCDNIIKNKQNIPFSEEEQKDITWAILAKEYDLTNYDDINVVRKKPRGSKGNLARIDGELNFDNLLLLCYDCKQKQSKSRRVSMGFRTSLDNKEWLVSHAKDKGMVGLAELMNQIIQEYRNNYEAESFEAEDSRRRLKELMEGKSKEERKRISKMVQIRGVENTIAELLANAEAFAATTFDEDDDGPKINQEDWMPRTDCEICARPFTINKFGQQLIQHYLKESDNGEKAWKSKKNTDGTRRTARNLAGFFLYEYGLDALNQYVLFQDKTGISEKVIELLRLSLVERVIAGDVVNLIEMMDMGDEVDDKPMFGKKFEEDFGSEGN